MDYPLFDKATASTTDPGDAQNLARLVLNPTDNRDSSAPWIAERIATENHFSNPAARFLAARGFMPGGELAAYFQPALPEKPKLEALPQVVEAARQIVAGLLKNSPITICYSEELDSVLAASMLKHFVSSYGVSPDVRLLPGPNFIKADNTDDVGVCIKFPGSSGVTAIELSTQVSGKVQHAKCDLKFGLTTAGMSTLLIAALEQELHSSDDWRSYSDYSASALGVNPTQLSEQSRKLLWQGCQEISLQKKAGFSALLGYLGVQGKVTPLELQDKVVRVLEQAVKSGESELLVKLLGSTHKNEAQIYTEELLNSLTLQKSGDASGFEIVTDKKRLEKRFASVDIEITLDEVNFAVEEELRTLHELGGKTANPQIKITGLVVGEREQEDGKQHSVELFDGSQKIVAVAKNPNILKELKQGERVDVCGALALSITPRREVVLLLDDIAAAEDLVLPPDLSIHPRKIQKPDWPVIISQDEESINRNLSQLLTRKGARLALDFETTVEENQQLCTVCVSDLEQRKNYFFDFVAGVEPSGKVKLRDTTLLKALLEDEGIVKVIHEEHFERKVSRSIGIFPRTVCDTRVLGQLLRPDLDRTGLKEFVWACLGKEMEKSVRVRDWARERNADGSIPQDLLDYAVCDTEYLAQLDDYQQALLKNTAPPANQNVADLLRSIARFKQHRWSFAMDHAPELEVLEAFYVALKERAGKLIASGALAIDGEAGIAQHGERSQEIDTDKFVQAWKNAADPYVEPQAIEHALQYLLKPTLDRTRLVRLLLQPENKALGFTSIIDIEVFLRECSQEELATGKSVIKPKDRVKHTPIFTEVDSNWGLARVMRELTNVGQRIQDIKLQYPRIVELDLSISRYEAQIEYLFSLGAQGFKGKSGSAAPTFYREVNPDLVKEKLRERAEEAPEIDIEKIITAVIHPKINRKALREVLESGLALPGEEAKLHFQDLPLRSREVQRKFFLEVSRPAPGFMPPHIIPGAR